MFLKSSSLARMMGCCNCFGFIRMPKQKPKPNYGFNNHCSQELLLDDDIEDDDDGSYNGEVTRTTHADESEPQSWVNRSEEILHIRELNGMICRPCPVKETRKVVRTEDENGNKMVNDYVRECKIGAGSYGKVVLYRSLVDGQHYAIKAFHKSHLLKLRVAPSETAMTDVLREPNAHFVAACAAKCAWGSSFSSTRYAEARALRRWLQMVADLEAAAVEVESNSKGLSLFDNFGSNFVRD